jgi:hypothetical protein
MRYIGEGAPLTRQQSEAQISYFIRHWGEPGLTSGERRGLVSHRPY